MPRPGCGRRPRGPPVSRSRARRGTAPRTPPPCPGRRGRRAPHRARRTRSPGRRGSSASRVDRSSRRALARSSLARWDTHTSTCRSPAASTARSPEPAQRPGGRADLLEGGDPPSTYRQERLDRQRAAEDRRGRADPAAAAEVLQGVDVEQRRRVAARRRAAAAASATEPPAAEHLRGRERGEAGGHARPDGCRRSSPGTGPLAAASCADSNVPLMSPERCTDRISSAPAARRRVVRLEHRRRSRPGRAHRQELAQRLRDPLGRRPRRTPRRRPGTR